MWTYKCMARIETAQSILQDEQSVWPIKKRYAVGERSRIATEFAHEKRGRAHGSKDLEALTGWNNIALSRYCLLPLASNLARVRTATWQSCVQTGNGWFEDLEST